MALKSNEIMVTASPHCVILSQFGHEVLMEGSCKYSVGQDHFECEMVLRSQRMRYKSGRKNTKYYPLAVIMGTEDKKMLDKE